MRKTGFFIAAIALLLLSGCASVQRASKSADAQAKLFAPTTDKATVYVYRDEFIGAAITMHLLIDGQPVGDTGPKTYVVQTLPPGDHVITSKAENDVNLRLSAEAGKTYFVWQEVKMGVLYARSALHLMDEDKGRAAVARCSLVESPAVANRPSPAEPTMKAAAVPATQTPPASPTQEAPAAAPAIPAAAAMPTATAENPQGLAALDPHVTPALFNAAQNVAAAEQCDRMIRVVSLQGTHSEFGSTCTSTATELRIACDGVQCQAMR